MPDLSIVIVNYNTRDLLRRCLESIRQARGGLDVDVIVVDNGSRDGSAAMVREEAPDVRLIEPGRNTWFSGGNNLGIRAATGDYVLMLNADTIILPGALPAMVAYLKQHLTVGAVACRQDFPGGLTIPICSKAPRYLDLLLGYTFLGALLAPWRDRRRRIMWYSDWDRLTTRPVEVIPNSCLMMPRALLDAFNGLDETLLLYFTEDDLCLRLHAAGYEVHYLADAKILHEEHASVKQVQRRASQRYFDDLILFTRKHYGRPRAALLHWLVIPTRWGMDLAQRLRGERDSL